MCRSASRSFSLASCMECGLLSAAYANELLGPTRTSLTKPYSRSPTAMSTNPSARGRIGPLPAMVPWMVVWGRRASQASATRAAKVSRNATVISDMLGSRCRLSILDTSAPSLRSCIVSARYGMAACGNGARSDGDCLGLFKSAPRRKQPAGLSPKATHAASRQPAENWNMQGRGRRSQKVQSLSILRSHQRPRQEGGKPSLENRS